MISRLLPTLLLLFVYNSQDEFIQRESRYRHNRLDNIRLDPSKYHDSINKTQEVPIDVWYNPCGDKYEPVCYVQPDLSLVPGNPRHYPCCWKCNKGMTMKVLHHEDNGYLDYMPCSGGCNWSTGDTLCFLPLPVLCVNKSGMFNPGYPPPPGGPLIGCDWLGGTIQATEPIQGCVLQSKAHGDEICAERFGSCWEMADYHSASYNGFVGIGDVENTPWVINYFSWALYGRFWVAHEDTPGANCWGN